MAARPRGATITAATIGNQLWISQEEDRVRLAQEEADFDKALSDSKTDSTWISSSKIENSDTSDTDSDRPPSGRHRMSGRNVMGAQGRGAGAGNSGQPAPQRILSSKSKSGNGKKKANAAARPGGHRGRSHLHYRLARPLRRRNLRRPYRPNQEDQDRTGLRVIQARRRQISRRQLGQRQHRRPPRTIPTCSRTLSGQRTWPTRRRRRTTTANQGPALSHRRRTSP